MRFGGSQQFDGRTTRGIEMVAVIADRAQW